MWEYFVTENNAHNCQIDMPISIKNPEGKCKHRYNASTNVYNSEKKKTCDFWTSKGKHSYIEQQLIRFLFLIIGND